VSPANTAPTSAALTRSITLGFTAEDGTTISGSLELSGLRGADDPNLQADWSAISQGPEMPCPADSSRDEVVIGTVAFTNETPNFTPTLNIMLASIGGPVSIGVAYSNEPRCEDLSSASGSQFSPAISPSFTSATWGPVPIEFVIPHYRSPAAPNGDPNLLKQLNVQITATQGPPAHAAGGYQITSNDSFIGDNSGPAISSNFAYLRFGQLQ